MPVSCAILVIERMINMVTILGKNFPTYDFDKIKGNCFGFIYVTVNNKTNKMYVGMHYRWDKSYLGSGVILKNAIKRDGKSSFTRYIIDTADSYEALVELEVYYITSAFGVNCAEHPMFYNITDKPYKQGSASWTYLTPEQREARIAKFTKTLQTTLGSMTEEEIEQRRQLYRDKANEAYKADPELRKRVSEGTRTGMTPEVRKHLSEVKTGVKQNLSIEERERRAEHMRKIGRKSTNPWNKGVSTKHIIGEKISLSQRKYYTVLLNDVPIIEHVNNVGSYQGIANKISEYFDGKPIGKNNVSHLITTGESYVAKIPSKQFMNGLRIVRERGDEGTHDKL